MKVALVNIGTLLDIVSHNVHASWSRDQELSTIFPMRVLPSSIPMTPHYWHGRDSMKAVGVLAGVMTTGLFVVLAGCNAAGSDWNKAVAQNTVASYQNFISAHPDDQRAGEAHMRLIAIQDDQAWAATSISQSADRYQKYLTAWPAGRHDQEAREAIASAETTDWNTAKTDGSVAAIQGFLQKYPNGADVAQAKAKLTELTAYRVELASEPTEIKAEHKLAQLKRRLGAKVQDLSVIPPASEGGKYSIASMGMSQAQAQQTCDSVKASHQPCEVVSGGKAS